MNAKMIKLRPYDSKTKKLWIEYVTHPDVIKNLSDRLRDNPDSFFDQIINNPNYFGIWLLDNTLVGHLTLGRFKHTGRSPEFGLGYWIAHPHWGNGYATAAVDMALRTLSAECPNFVVRASVLIENVASMKVLKKLGFRRTQKAGPIPVGYGTELNHYVLTSKRWETR